MADVELCVELCVEAGVDPAAVDVAELRQALVRSGARVTERDDTAGAAAADVTVVVGDLERADELLGRHAGRATSFVLVQGSHFPTAGHASRPAADPGSGKGVIVCVWGAAARSEMARRLPAARILITGLPSRDHGLAGRMPHASPPVVDPNGEVVALVRDPADPPAPLLAAVLERVEGLLGRRLRRLPLSEIGGEQGPRPAIAIGSASAGYLAAVRAGVPLIVVDDGDAAHPLPRVQHHLVASAADVDRAEELVVASLITGRFWGNSAGDLLEWHVAPAGGIDAVVRAILRRELPAAPDRWDARLTVVGSNFGRDVGLAIPVMTLASAVTGSGRCPVEYVDARAFVTDAQYRSWIPAGQTVLVNGLETLTTAPPLRRFVQSRLDAGEPAFVYIHLTEAGLERERSRRPGELQAAIRLLRRCTVLCVSEYQERLFRGLGVSDTRVVYNTSPSLSGSHAAPPAARPLPSSPRIVMAGTLQERKGVDLFSRVADLAADRHPDWRFEWAGSANGPLPEITRSDRVRWLGRLDRDRLAELLRESDLFFLSSRDDPMPLAVVEAIGSGLRVVSFDRVGAFEILNGADGYAAFSEYQPEAALAAIADALAGQPDPDRWMQVRKRFTVEAFTERMRAALGIRSSGGGAEPPRRLPTDVPPAYPIPAAAIADPALPAAFRAVLTRAALRHAAEPQARLRLADRLLAAGDAATARNVLAAAGVRRLPELPDTDRLARVLRRRSARPGRLLRLISAVGRRSISWGRRLRRGTSRA